MKAFSGLSSLTVLNLMSNGIKNMSEKSFEGLMCLDSLILGFNDIRSIQKNTFFGLIRLRKLDMKNMMILELNSGSFQWFSKPKHVRFVR